MRGIEDPTQLRVLTLNTHKGFSPLNRRYVLRDLRQAIRDVGADIVFMQEVLGDHERLDSLHDDLETTPSQYEFMADTIWDNYAYGRNAVYDKGHHGNALMSRYPIVNYRNIDVSASRVEQRGLLHCEIPLAETGITLHAVSLHLGLLESFRRRQLADLRQLLELIPDTDPVLVAGDFNDWWGTGHRLLSACGLSEVHAEAQGKVARTYPARLPLLRLDRIYVRGVHTTTPLDLPARPWAMLSDHKPLAADVCILEPGTANREP